LTRLGISCRHLSLKIAAPKKQGSAHHWNFSMVHIGQRFAPAFNLPYIYMRDYGTKLCRQQAEVIQNHENEYVRVIGKGEARYRKYKRLKLGGGQAYDR
jgi:hypothetical protein